jgi:hypothetical protein
MTYIFSDEVVQQITERYGLLQSKTQLAELLGRCIYYPTTEVAGLIKGTSNE